MPGYEILSGVATVLFIPSTIYTFWSWYMTVRFYGRTFLRALVYTIAISTATRRIWGAIVGMGAILLAFRLIASRGLTFTALFGVVAGTCLLSSSWIPPSAVFLGTIRGSEKQISLYRKLDDRTPFLRRVQLKLAPLKLAHFQERAADTASFFVGGNDPWQLIVFMFLDIVPIVVVDGRIVTRAVLYEAEQINKSDELRAKSWFIAGPDGTSAVLDALRAKLGVAVLDLHEVPAAEVLRKIENHTQSRLRH